jgi:hypothetical protein
MDTEDKGQLGAQQGITPSQCDIDVVDKQCGRLPRDATAEQKAERYHQYRAQALIRIFRSGEPSDALMQLWVISAGERRGKSTPRHRRRSKRP